VEASVAAIVGELRLVVEALGAAIIGLGVLVAAAGFARGLVRGHADEFTGTRLTLGRFLSLALEFQLGAAILSIAVIRTTLNYFLTQELRETGERVATEPRWTNGPGDAGAREAGSTA
jgi:uncharacterized membrane protein